MKCMVAAFAIVALAAAGMADAFVLHPTKTAEAPWQLSTQQPAINLAERIPMNIAMKRKNVDKLERILLEVSDPKSSKYGDHLNNEQMRELVGADATAIAQVKAWLARHGINSVDVAVHEDAMKFKATRAQVSSLLDVQWATYDNKDTSMSMVRALGATIIPDYLQDTIDLLQGHRGWPTPASPKKQKKADFGTSVTPKVIYEVYNETNNIPTTPAGMTNVQSFAQFQGQYVLASDLTSFCAKYLPGTKGACKITKYIGGTDGSTPGVESSLDSEYIYATSYGAETWVYTYSGIDFCGDLLTWAQDVFAGENATHPNVISMSYGSQALNKKGEYCEGTGAVRLNVDTMKMGAMGISVVVASGDEGSGEFPRGFPGYNGGYLSPAFPSELPYVTAVGSTTFESGSSGTQKAAGFSGGGFSWNWDARSYQQASIKSYLESGVKLPNSSIYNATGRATPDVSFLGMGFEVISAGSTQPVGGTSCSTPSFSGMVTLLNNIRLQNGKTLGFLNPLLYANPNGFTDITSGTNTPLFGSGYIASKGWDPVTGLGTPNFGMLAEIVKAVNAKENAAQKH